MYPNTGRTCAPVKPWIPGPHVRQNVLKKLTKNPNKLKRRHIKNFLRSWIFAVPYYLSNTAILKYSKHYNETPTCHGRNHKQNTSPKIVTDKNYCVRFSLILSSFWTVPSPNHARSALHGSLLLCPPYYLGSKILFTGNFLYFHVNRWRKGNLKNSHKPQPNPKWCQIDEYNTGRNKSNEFFILFKRELPGWLQTKRELTAVNHN